MVESSDREEYSQTDENTGSFVFALLLLSGVSLGRVAQPMRAQTVDLIHAENDYSTTGWPLPFRRIERLHKPHLLKVYPPVGQTIDDGPQRLGAGGASMGKGTLRTTTVTRVKSARVILAAST
jgi:hypothetical protein